MPTIQPCSAQPIPMPRSHAAKSSSAIAHDRSDERGHRRRATEEQLRELQREQTEEQRARIERRRGGERRRREDCGDVGERECDQADARDALAPPDDDREHRDDGDVRRHDDENRPERDPRRDARAATQSRSRQAPPAMIRRRDACQTTISALLSSPARPVSAERPSMCPKAGLHRERERDGSDGEGRAGVNIFISFGGSLNKSIATTRLRCDAKHSARPYESVREL